MNQGDKNDESIDLSGRLKSSDSGIEFQGGKQRPAQIFLPGTPKIIQWIIKYSGGLIKNEKQASYVMVGFAVMAIVIALLLLSGDKEKPLKPGMPGTEIFRDIPPEVTPPPMVVP
ncbi:MAG: hypothetical protein V1905_01160 [bacterium]